MAESINILEQSKNEQNEVYKVSTTFKTTKEQLLSFTSIDDLIGNREHEFEEVDQTNFILKISSQPS